MKAGRREQPGWGELSHTGYNQYSESSPSRTLLPTLLCILCSPGSLQLLPSHLAVGPGGLWKNAAPQDRQDTPTHVQTWICFS